jgi:hypothetical protein
MALLAVLRLTGQQASEPETSQAARLCCQGHDRRAWLNAIHVPRRWSLRRCVERGSDAQPALIGFGRPAVVRPRLRNTRQCARLGHSRSITLDHDVRVADRHRDRTPSIARDIAPLPRARARLEPKGPSSHRAPTALTCGLPSSLTVDSQVVREFAASGAGADPAASFPATAAQSTGDSPSALPRLMISIRHPFIVQRTSWPTACRR